MTGPPHRGILDRLDSARRLLLGLDWSHLEATLTPAQRKLARPIRHHERNALLELEEATRQIERVGQETPT